MISDIDVKLHGRACKFSGVNNRSSQGEQILNDLNGKPKEVEIINGVLTK